MPAIETKNSQLIAYIIKNHPNVSITGVMKLCYLIDLYSTKNNGKKISDFNYIRYYYGPYDKNISLTLDLLVDNGVIIPSNDFTPSGNDYVSYSFNEDSEIKFDKIQKEKELIDTVLSNLVGYGAKTLTEVAYKTKPMLKIGATLGGAENIGTKLDLNAN